MKAVSLPTFSKVSGFSSVQRVYIKKTCDSFLCTAGICSTLVKSIYGDQLHYDCKPSCAFNFLTLVVEENRGTLPGLARQVCLQGTGLLRVVPNCSERL